MVRQDRWDLERVSGYILANSKHWPWKLAHKDTPMSLTALLTVLLLPSMLSVAFHCPKTDSPGRTWPIHSINTSFL